MADVEITVTMTKTIQEKQFEPMVISLSVKTIVPQKDAEDEFLGQMDNLESLIEEKFKDRGVL